MESAVHSAVTFIQIRGTRETEWYVLDIKSSFSTWLLAFEDYLRNGTPH